MTGRATGVPSSPPHRAAGRFGARTFRRNIARGFLRRGSISRGIESRVNVLEPGARRHASRRTNRSRGPAREKRASLLAERRKPAPERAPTACRGRRTREEVTNFSRSPWSETPGCLPERSPSPLTGERERGGCFPRQAASAMPRTPCVPRRIGLARGFALRIESLYTLTRSAKTRRSIDCRSGVARAHSSQRDLGAAGRVPRSSKIASASPPCRVDPRRSPGRDPQGTCSQAAPSPAGTPQLRGARRVPERAAGEPASPSAASARSPRSRDVAAMLPARPSDDRVGERLPPARRAIASESLNAIPARKLLLG